MTAPSPRKKGVLNHSPRKGGNVFLSPSKEEAGSLIKVMIDQPEQISQIAATNAAQSLAVRIFGEAETLNAGAAFFSTVTPEDLLAEGLKERAEGTEYPMVRITPPDLKKLTGTDIGGKFKVTDEAMEEGVIDVIRNGLATISNSMTTYLDEMAVEALKSSTDMTGEIHLGNNWASIVLNGATPTPPGATAAADIIRSKADLATNGLRAVGNLLVLNPFDEADLKITYGDQYAALLDSLEIQTATSPVIPAKVAYLVATDGLGGVTSKNGVVTETWRDPEVRATWVQTYLEPALYISLPSNIVRIHIDDATTEG